jgi:hypothetical protein
MVYWVYILTLAFGTTRTALSGGRNLPPRKFLGRLLLKCDGTRAETRFLLSAKRTSLFKSAGVSVQSTPGRGGVRISGSNAGYTMFRGSVRVMATHSIHQFPLHFPSRSSLCAIIFQLDSTHFCYRLSGPQGCCMWIEGIGHLQISKYANGNRTRSLPSCGAVPQPNTSL